MSPWRLRLRGLFKRVLGTGLRATPLEFVRAVFEVALEQLHRRGPEFVTARTLPKSGATGPYRVLDPLLPPVGPEPIGVVLQGPLLLDDDFTVETVRYYSRACPHVAVVVSTWAGENAASVERVRSLGADVVLSAKPPVPGRINVNYQTRSASAGIRRAIELGCRFVAKTRSDQRVLCLPLVLSLPRYLDYFPPRNAPNQHRRLVAASWGTAPFCPYYIADQFMFGTCEDMLAFWTPPLDETNESRDTLMAARDKEVTLEGFSSYAPEHYLIRHFLSRDGGKLPFELRAWWRVLGDRFCVINWSDLDIYWPKGEPNVERRDYVHDDGLIGHPLRVWDWLALYAGLGDVPSPSLESLLTCPHDSTLPPRLPHVPQVGRGVAI